MPARSASRKISDTPQPSASAADALLRADERTVFSVSVRELVSFVLQRGNLGGSGEFVGPNRALEGTRGHQRLQKNRPASYKAEVTVSRKIQTAHFDVELRGRIDGVMDEGASLFIEEIKTVRRGWEGEADPLHLAQAKIYGFLHGSETGATNITVQITYLDLEADQTTEIRSSYGIEELRLFFEQVLGEYLDWLQRLFEWRVLRDESIRKLPFPFPSYRPGQRTLAVAVYRTLRKGGRLFAEAPTGIGKTVSVLFPAVKALAESEVEKMFYLTAKTMGRTVAEKAVDDLRRSGLRLRTVTLTAKEKVCFNGGQPCDMAACPYALGYYDRVKAALREALQSDSFTRSQIEGWARKHTVCPFELSLDIAVWADAVICDYNYALDPSVSLRRFFGEEKRHYAILVDEAHNLVDRAREMFSAGLDEQELSGVQKAIETDLPSCARALVHLRRAVAALAKKENGWELRGAQFVKRGAPESLLKPVKEFQSEAEAWLARNEPAGFRQMLLELYFRVLSFRRVLESFDERYASLFDEKGTLRLFCLDPSALLRAALKGNGAAVFFSATLRPLEFFREVLGGGERDDILRLNSPFNPAHLGVMVQDRIATRYSARANSYDAVAEAIAAFVSGRTGNYLVYFPSFDYLGQVMERFRRLRPDCRVQAQIAGMAEAEREKFVEAFREGGLDTLAGFAVMGGIFGEGIDLVGERLIGVAVVGPGLPQVCAERDLIREYCDDTGRPGFDYAYCFPGMSRVLQAAGRLIRSESDRGVVLLIDERFRTARYRDLFPAWWFPRFVRTPAEIKEAVTRFWNGDILAPKA